MYAKSPYGLGVAIFQSTRSHFKPAPHAAIPTQHSSTCCHAPFKVGLWARWTLQPRRRASRVGSRVPAHRGSRRTSTLPAAQTCSPITHTQTDRQTHANTPSAQITSGA
eukprot:315198-Rhodomonas_salina.2